MAGLQEVPVTVIEADDRKVMDEVVAEAVKAIGAIERESTEIAMNRYNGWTATSASAGKENDK